MACARGPRVPRNAVRSGPEVGSDAETPRSLRLATEYTTGRRAIGHPPRRKTPYRICHAIWPMIGCVIRLA